MEGGDASHAGEKLERNVNVVCMYLLQHMLKCGE
jgi:hypothetical protein